MKFSITKREPFPQTKQDILDLKANNVTIFSKLLETKELRRPLPKRDGQYNQCQEQSKSVRDALISLFCDVRWSHLSTDINGWQVWSYDDKELDDKICLYTKKLGHILNKLAEFNDDELTKHFVERIAEQLKKPTAETSKLLQEFHIFTKTPSTSRSQSSVILAIEQCVSDFFRNVSGFQYYCYSEGCVSLVGKPYISGYADGIIEFTKKVSGEKYLIFVEYDGIGKTPDQLSARKSRYSNFNLDYNRLVIDGEELENVKSVDIICGNREDILKEKLYAVFIERKEIPGTVFWLLDMQNVFLPEGLFK